MSSDADHQVCGMSVAIDVVGGKWKLHLMWALGANPQRFGEIRRLLTGVSEKVLDLVIAGGKVVQANNQFGVGQKK